MPTKFLYRLWAEPDDGGVGGDKPAGDVAYFQAEAKKAFAARDAAKALVKELEARALPPERIKRLEELEAAAAHAEEDRKRRAGEFDAWRASIQKAHDDALKAEHQAREAAEQRYRDRLIATEFADATELFGGGERALTTLPHRVAQSYLAKFVEVRAFEREDGTTEDLVVVKNLRGGAMLDPQTQRPVPFAQAMRDVISQLPDKDSLLRGSGKAGSGSPGSGSPPRPDTDLRSLIDRARKGDKTALDALKARQKQAGGMVIGPAFQ